jgi:hypothetical protein
MSNKEKLSDKNINESLKASKEFSSTIQKRQDREIIIERCEKYLVDIFPTARTGFIKILMEALELHAKKNADYNGVYKDEVSPNNDIVAKFFDVRRKYGRLKHLILDENEMQVDEKLMDTALDLGNYGFLLAECLGDLKDNKQSCLITKL